jgi:cation:H+ antiporter
MLAVVVLAFMAMDTLIDGAPASVLTRGDGLVLIAFFVIFLYYIFGLTQADAAAGVKTDDSIAVFGLSKSITLVLVGLVGLVIGGKWIVDGAVTFATALGVSQALIGLTIVAIGTSLPELATSVVAARKRQVDIAVGNVIGSNIFNIFWILGISAMISPLPFSPALGIDLAVTLGATLFLFVALFVGARHTLERWQGWLFIATYLVYVVFLVWRG